MFRRKSSPRGSRGARRLKLTLVLVAVALSLSIAALTFASRDKRLPSKKSESAATSRNPGSPGKNTHIRRGQLWPNLKDALAVVGNRLEMAGKERITLTGKLSGQNAGDFVLVHELPDRVRFQEQGIAQSRTIAFDGREAWKVGGSPDRFESALLETLLYDLVDRLFIAQAGGAATRFLGSRFRLDDGNAADANGIVYDIYQVNEQITVGREARSQTRSYYLNSDTLLLDRVRYELEGDGTKTRIEVLLNDWRDVQGQKIPFRITRLENGEPTITLAVATATLGPPVSDGIFKQPQGNR